MYPDPELVDIIGWEREREADLQVTGTWQGLGPQLLTELRNAGGQGRRGARSIMKQATRPLAGLVARRHARMARTVSIAMG